MSYSLPLPLNLLLITNAANCTDYNIDYRSTKNYPSTMDKIFCFYIKTIYIILGKIVSCSVDVHVLPRVHLWAHISLHKFFMEVYDYLMILSLKYHIDPGFLAPHYNRPDDTPTTFPYFKDWILGFLWPNENCAYIIWNIGSIFDASKRPIKKHPVKDWAA